MLIRLLTLLFILGISLYAAVLKSDYTLVGREFNATMIDPTLHTDFILYTFDDRQHRKSFSSSRIIKAFALKGIALEDKSGGFVHLTRRSHTDLAPIKEAIKQYYQEHIEHISIKSITLKSNGFIESLPSGYELDFKPKAFFHSTSSLKISSPNSHERYFITYKVDALIKLFKARHNINRGKILTPIDLIYKEVPLTRLRGMPLQQLERGQMRMKKRIVKGNILYTHDIEHLPAVLKNKPVNVRLINGKVRLEFQAISLQDARVGEKIFIKKADGKRLRARVISRNLVEIE